MTSTASRIGAGVAAGLLLCAFSPLAANAVTIGTAPSQSTGASSRALRAARAQYEARLAAQRQSYNRQVEILSNQLASLQRQKTAWLRRQASDQERIRDLSLRVVGLKSGASSIADQAQQLSDQTQSLRVENASLLEAQASLLQKVDYLTSDNERLGLKANRTRPSIARDPADWVTLALGVVLGGLTGMALGVRRGQKRAAGEPIPNNVAAWWGGDAPETPETQE